MFNRKLYQKNWYLTHKKKCINCGKLIKFNSTKCKSCETKSRWENGFNPSHPPNSGQFKKGEMPRTYIALKKWKENGGQPWNKGIVWNNMRGNKHPNWQGGLTEKNWDLRMSTKYRDWRIAVFKRDNYTCIQCGGKYKIEADHIKPVSLFKNLILSIDNGRTLCHKCHVKTETYAGKLNRRNYNYA